MNRRQFAQLATGAVVGATSLKSGRAQSPPDSPAKFTSINGVLEAVLEPAFIQKTFGGRDYKLVAYNGRIPGPVLEARPGDLVRVRLNNRLDHPTNLHFHGLHIPPTGIADNSFLTVHAGESFLYEFKIPQNHPAGLYWYHPHVHSLSNVQVRSGMAGMISIRGDLDMIGDLPNAVEQDIVLQNLAYFVYDPPHTSHPSHIHVHHPAPDNPPPVVLLVNGVMPDRDAAGNVRNATKVRTAGLLRLRILHIGANRTTRLALVNPARVLAHHPFLIAADGVPLAVPELVNELLLAPGSRAELLIETNISQGKFSLFDIPYYDGRSALAPPAALATFEYSGEETRALRMPERLGTVEPLPLADAPPRRFEYTILDDNGRLKFLINGVEFDSERVDARVKLGSIEDWEFVNTSFEDHSVHLHTNSFQVLDSYGNPEPMWRDTIPLLRGRSVRLRTRFADFTGKSFFHCHSLIHEDNSMMQIVEIVD